MRALSDAPYAFGGPETLAREQALPDEYWRQLARELAGDVAEWRDRCVCFMVVNGDEVCAATVALGVRSYYYWDNCVWSGRACVAGCSSNWGGVSFFLDTPADPADWPFTGSRLQFSGERRTWAMGVGIPTSQPALNPPW